MPWSFFFRRARILTGLRLGHVLLALALVFGLSTVSDAQVAGANGHPWYCSGGGRGGDPTSACTAAFGMVASSYSYASSGSVSCVANGDGTWSCATGKSIYDWSGVANPVASSCLDGYTLQSDGSCKSNVVSCTDPSLMNKYKGVGWTTSSTSSGAPDYICVKGCQYDPGGVTVTYPNSSSLTGYTSGGRAGAASGKSCDMTNWPQITIDVDLSNATDPKTLPPSPEVCAAQGRFYGQVNGADVCSPAIPPGGSVSSNNGTTTTQPGGTGASAPAGTSPDTSTSNTTCDGQNCTTTTIVVGGGGRTVVCGSMQVAASSTPSASGPATNDTCSTTVTVPQQQFCQQNPNAVVCKDDSASGGADCSAPPSCSGDAISCAILRQQWNTRCELQKGGDSASTLGQQIQAGNDPMASQLPTPGKADQVDMSSKFSNVDDMGFVAQCLADLDIPLVLPGGSTTLHISTAPLCDIGKLLGYLQMLSTLMLCAYMLKGSF